MVFFNTLSLAFAFGTGVFSTPTNPSFANLQLRDTTQPIVPSQDPWYTAPSGFESTTPGTLLKIRHAPGNGTSLVGNCSAVYNILFRSTDSNFEPTFGVTTLFVPSVSSNTTSSSSANGTDSSEAKLLSLQVAYNSADVDASPSYAIYTPFFTSPSLGAPPATDDIAYFLSQGFYVSLTDFEGPHAAFTLGLQAGHSVLDSVRAVLGSDVFPGSSTEDSRVAMWGYSGGSLASEWASELQEQYAPELEFKGMAVGGLVTNVTNVVYNINGGPYAGLLPGGLLGMTAQDAEAREYLLSKLKPTGPTNSSYFLQDLNYTVTDAFAAYPGVNLFSFFQDGEKDVFAPILQDIFDRNSYMGTHGVPRMPTFLYKAIGDEFTSISYTDSLVDWYCSVGASIWFQRNTIGGHIDEIVNGRGRVLSWLSSVFEGTYDRTGCFTENVTVNISSSGI